MLYLGRPFGRGKVGGCSPSKLPGAEGGVSRALWWEEVSSSGSTVWQAWSFRWKRWPQYRNLWDTVSTLEKSERSANVTAHCRQRNQSFLWGKQNMQKNHQIIVWTDRLSENCVKPVETSWAKVAIYQNMWAKPSERRARLTSTSYLVKRSINMLGDHHDSWTNVRVGRGGHSSRTKASWGWSRVGHMLDYPSLLAYSSAYTLSQSAGIHEDVFTQWVGISCGKRHRNTGGEGHLEENKKQLRIFS